MSLPAHGSFARACAAAIIGGLLLAGCASGSNDGSAGAGSDAGNGTAAAQIIGDQSDAGEPASGGTLNYATYSPVNSLDPAVASNAGTAGGSEMAALYDVLVRYDIESKTYEPKLAKSLEASEDNLTWTMKLREDVTFSDGSAFDAHAVAWSINHFLEGNGNFVGVWNDSVADMTTPDQSTVVVTLKQPWAEFPVLLTSGPGSILAPSSEEGGRFTPIGAGPFTVDTFTPPTELVLKARPDYWDGAPYLDALRFVTINGNQAKVDSLRSGGIQMGYLNDPEVIDATIDDFPGYLENSSLGSLVMINSRPDRPGSDIRVRQAMAYAIDPEIVSQRVDNGTGLPGSEIFQSFSQWHNDVAPLAYDPEKAKQLFETAKQDGYDGQLSYVAVQNPASQTRAVAVQSMLQAVGFTVDIAYSPDATDVIRKIYAEHDFDLAQGAFNLYEAAPFVRLFANLSSDSGRNAIGLKDPNMDAALAKVQSASNEADKHTALADIQRLVNKTTPFLALGATPNYIPWQEIVYGVIPSFDGILLFDKVWLAE